jgi:hypothetical protein
VMESTLLRCARCRRRCWRLVRLVEGHVGGMLERPEHASAPHPDPRIKSGAGSLPACSVRGRGANAGRGDRRRVLTVIGLFARTYPRRKWPWQDAPHLGSWGGAFRGRRLSLRSGGRSLDNRRAGHTNRGASVGIRSAAVGRLRPIFSASGSRGFRRPILPSHTLGRRRCGDRGAGSRE